MVWGSGRRGGRLGLLAATALCVAGPAWAAEADAVATVGGDAGAALSELTVTAVQVRQSAGLKTDTPVAETPQSISVITAEQIALRGAQSVQDILNYTAGVRSDAYGNDGRVDSYNIRAGSPVQFLDGMKLNYSSYNTAKVDPYALERVEVLRGPSSVLYGQGSTGGLVNLVTKRPGTSRAGEVVVSYGSHDRKQVQMDFTGPVDADGKFAMRITSLLRQSGSQVDHIDDDRWFIAPSLTWRPSDRAEVTVLLHHQRDKTGSTTQFLPWEGRIYANPNGHLSTRTFIGDPSWERFNTEQTNLTLASRFKLNDRWELRQNLRAAWSQVDYQTMYPNSYTNPLNPWLQPGDAGYTGVKRSIGRYLSASYPHVLTYTADTQLQGDFTTGPLSHQLLVGLDAQDYKQKLTQIAARLITPVDLFNPVYGNYSIPAVTAGNTTKQGQAGLYLQDQIALGGLKLVLGARRDRATSQTLTPAGVRTKKKDAATSYRAAALYTLENGLAPYVSYSESFTPVAGANLAGVAFNPQTGRQWEGGIKYQPAAAYLLTAAAYDIRETNRVTTSPTNPLDRVQTGEVHTKGFELEGRAAIGEAWMLTAAYTYTDAAISKSNVAGEVGKPFAAVPKHGASAWAARRFQLGEAGFVRLGGGVRYIGKTVDRNAASTIVITTPSYTLADLVVSYDTDDWRLALNVNNLFDKDYDATCLARGDCFIGARRSVVGSLTRRF